MEEIREQEPQSRRARLRAWAIRNAHSPFATPTLLLLTFAEAIFFPIPVDVFLIPLIIIRARSWVYYTIIASVTSVAGGIVGYAIGFFLFDLVGAPIVALYGFEEELALVEMWLLANVFLATFISAFTPIPYKVFTLAAGFLGAPFLLFVVASLLGRGIRYALVCYIAHRWGESFARLFLKHFKLATLLTVLLALLYLLIKVL